MKRPWLAAIVAMAASGPAWAQSSTASGTGVGTARSTSTSQAISGQGGTGVGVAAITTSSSVPADQTVKNVPSVVAPGLAAAGLETCLGSVSGGGAVLGTGLSFGTTIPDPGCAARLDARTLWSMGLKKAAVARLCLNGDIYRAMPEVCRQYMPPAPGYPHQPLLPTRDVQATEDSPSPSATFGRGKETGKIRLCNDYDVTQQRCRVWAHTVHHSVPKKKLVPSSEVTTRQYHPPRHPPWRKPKKGGVAMKKLLMSVAFVALVGSILPADAGSTLAVGGGFNLGNVTTITGAGTLGNAAAASAAQWYQYLGRERCCRRDACRKPQCGHWQFHRPVGRSVRCSRWSGWWRGVERRLLQQRRCRCRRRLHQRAALSTQTGIAAWW